MTTKSFSMLMAATTFVLVVSLTAQVQTDVPAPVPGAKPVAVEHIKIHGAHLEGNLEGDAVDRDVFVFLPPSYTKKNHGTIPSYTGCTVIPSVPSSGRMKFMCRKRSKGLSPKTPKN